MFISTTGLIPLSNGRDFKTEDVLSWQAKDGTVIEVAKGFVTDLASIPRLFWNILPPFGKYTLAAIVHDWLYRNHIGERKVADARLLEIMQECGVPWWQRQIIYRNVRLFGWASWRDDARLLKTTKQ